MTHTSHFHPGDLKLQNVIIDLTAHTGSYDIDEYGETVLPYDYDVDYVRVYQLDTSMQDINCIDCNLDEISNLIYNYIEIGGSGDLIINSGQNYTFRSNTGVLLEPGFCVESGGQVLIDVTPKVTNEFEDRLDIK